MRTIALLCALLCLGSCTMVVYEATGDNCTGLFYTEKHSLSFDANNTIDLAAQKYTATCDLTGENTRSITIKYEEIANTTYKDISLVYGFTTTDTGYWGSTDITLKYNDGSDTTVKAAFTDVAFISTQFSYACTYDQVTTFIKTNSTTVLGSLSMRTYQLQLWSVTDAKFSSAFHCVNYISKGAWMGVTTGLLMIVVLVLSVMMLLNTTTPDRFETSKSKCLIIPHEH